MVVENYPELKSDQNFRDLQAQLEGTENRITVARNRYIESVQDFNVTVRPFPTNLTAMLFGYKVKPNFTVENEAAIARPPTVDFSTPAPAPRRTERRRPRRAPAGELIATRRLPLARSRGSAAALLRRAAVASRRRPRRWSPFRRSTAPVTDLTGTLDRRPAGGARREAARLRAGARAARSRC